MANELQQPARVVGKKSYGKCRVKQKQGYLARQEDSATGEVTIGNNNSIAYLDNTGQFEGGYTFGTVSDLGAGTIETNGAVYYWDVPGFRSDYPGVSTNAVAPSTTGATNTFRAVPARADLYSYVDISVDMGRGLPAQEVYTTPDGSTLLVTHQSPTLINSTIWLPAYDAMTLTYFDGSVLEWRQSSSNIQINQGLTNSLFALPAVPK